MAAKRLITSTRWTVIRRAQGGGPEARAALEQLVKRYDSYIEASLRRSWRPPDLPVEDAKQEFLEQLLKGLPRVEEGRGRFRGWLSCAIRHYLCNVRRRWLALGNAGRFTECADLWVLSTPHTPEDELLRSFAIDTLRHAQRLQRDRASNLGRLEALRHFLPGPDLSLEEISAVAARLGLTTVATRKAIHDLRAQFRECLHEAVADTLDPEECGDGDASSAVERELRQLCSSLFPARWNETAVVY